MSSLTRRIQRKRARVANTYENAPELYRAGGDGEGYSVCHRTKGWRRYAAVRIHAGMKLQQMVTGVRPWRFGNAAA